MDIYKVLTLIFSLVLILATLASVLKRDEWWIRVFDFPRVQIVIINLVMIGATLLSFNFTSAWPFLLLAALGFSIGYQFRMIYPYTPLASRQVVQYKGVAQEDLISIMVSNVLMTNKKAHKLKNLVKKYDPDILLTLETNKWWEEQLEEIEHKYAYTVKIPLDNLYGMHLYSKLELENAEVGYLVQDGIPSVKSNLKMRSGKRIKIYCLHPKPPSPTEADTSTNRDAELLLVGKEVAKNNKSTLVFGDLNDVAWSRTTQLFQKLSGLLDPRIGRGFFNTFHAQHPLFRWPLDHVFHSSDFTLVDIKRLPSVGSDHFPMYAQLNYGPVAEKVQERPGAESEERVWAKEKIEKADPVAIKLRTKY
ncbi:endonuclease/exonuclease/phosphatase family protein [Roseivirga sp. BDSF3-8]|uniref:endonuclease/exonuclease/phosphatase family protein n=1 Tax=Roseivirga sp. BDSF3-8 TaxID=3241598 RepID=UPI003531D1B1